MMKTRPSIWILLGLLAGSVLAADLEIEPPGLLPQCNTSALRVVVNQFVCRTDSCRPRPPAPRVGSVVIVSLAQQLASTEQTGRIGDDVADLLMSGLRRTGCFEVLERQNLAELYWELERAGKSVPVLQSADVLISGSIVGFGFDEAALSFGAGMLPIIGSVGTKTQRAWLSFDLRMLDVQKASLVDSPQIDAKTRKVAVNVGEGGWLQADLSGPVSNLRGTVVEEVVQKAVLRAVIAITERLAAGKITARIPVEAGPVS